MEFLTVAEVRARFGEDVDEMTDESILRQVDQMVAHLVDELGHGFGDAMIATSTEADTVEVTAAALIIGGDTYTFADYATLGALAAAVNAAGGAYAVDLAPHVRYDAPSTLLRPLAAVSCGPAYSDRARLEISALYVKGDGGRRSHFFLPLPLASVSAVTENGVALTSAYYWASAGDRWIIRKSVPCTEENTFTAKGRWSGRAPGNVAVTYLPHIWGRVPGALKLGVLDGFASFVGVAPLESESFLSYRYARGSAPVESWREYLGGGAVRRYAVKMNLV